MVYQSGSNGQSSLMFTYAPSLHLGLAYTLLERIKIESSAELYMRQLRP